MLPGRTFYVIINILYDMYTKQNTQQVVPGPRLKPRPKRRGVKVMSKESSGHLKPYERLALRAQKPSNAYKSTKSHLKSHRNAFFPMAPRLLLVVLSCTWYSPWPCASHPAVQHLGTASKSLSKAKEPQDPVEARRQHGLELDLIRDSKCYLRAVGLRGTALKPRA